MIPLTLLKNYQSRALGICSYGNGGLRKTLAARTLPSPILHLDFEGGSGCLGPWTRRIRKWDGQWVEYSQEEREELLRLVIPDSLPTEEAQKRRAQSLLKPAPLIDIISFDVLAQSLDSDVKAPAYEQMFKVIANFDPQYNSVAIDPLIEFSTVTQTKSKTLKGISTFEPMTVDLWGGAQERAAILLRRLRNYRDQGVFIYLTSSEFVDKDYGTDPRSKEKGAQAEEPYAIKGTVNVPGKLVREVNHMIDIQCHVRLMGGEPVWVTQEEPARSSSFNWEAKDRTGRLDKYMKPSIINIIERVYGKEAREAIYA